MDSKNYTRRNMDKLNTEFSNENFINKLYKRKTIIAFIGLIIILLNLPVFFLSYDVYYVISPVLYLLGGLCYMFPLIDLYIHKDSEYANVLKKVAQESTPIIVIGVFIVLTGFLDVFHGWTLILT